MMLPFDAVASSALIVAALWTKVAGRSNFSLSFFLMLALDVPQSDRGGRFVTKGPRDWRSAWVLLLLFHVFLL